MTEILIATGIAGFVLTTAVAALHRVMRQQQIQRAAIDCQVSVTRLAITFRKDVHQSHTCRLAPADDSHPKLVLDGPNDTHIQYTVNGPGVDRRVNRSAVVVHRDRFPVGRDCLVQWEIEQTPDRAVLAVRHQHIPQPPPPRAGNASGPADVDARQPRAVRIEAVIGRDYRFAPPKEGDRLDAT